MKFWKTTIFSVKHLGIAIKNPTLTAWKNWTALCMVTVQIFTGLGGRVEFHYGNHAQLPTNGCTETRCQKAYEAEEALSEAVEALSP